MSIEDEGGRPDGLAPVIPLFAERRWHTTWTDETTLRTPGSRHEPNAARAADLAGVEATHPPAPDDDRVRAAAESALLRKLRARSLSVREARGVLRENGLGDSEIEEIVDAFLGRGYLDDARLAEQLIHVGADRKGQGRGAIRQTMSTRGIAREVIDAALAEMVDDDAERAVEFARGKARSFRGMEREVALRRLVGQLARRGYAGQVAMAAARTALDEVDRPSVRFE